MTVFTSGSKIGFYKIESQVGEGGMGVVFKALDTKLNRRVAVKLLSDNLADADGRRRFQREAQTASSLNHPHILTVYDAGEFEGRQYLVTEYIDGGTLSEWSKGGTRTWRDVVELLTGVADGLRTAHEAKILHRDIKPANILVMQSGYAKLADFGLAKLAEESPSPTDETKTRTDTLTGRTRAGMVMGTIAYMSPEQAQGKAIDARSDIFSFGVVLYEQLAGQRPFDGRNDLETLQRVIHEVPPILGEHIPAALRTLVEKALKKDPEERYQSMREMVADLRSLARASDGQPLPTPVQPTPVASERESRRALRKFVAVTVMLFAVAAGTWYLLAPKGPVTIPSEFVQITNFSDYATAPAISPDGSNPWNTNLGGYMDRAGARRRALASDPECRGTELVRYGPHCLLGGDGRNCGPHGNCYGPTEPCGTAGDLLSIPRTRHGALFLSLSGSTLSSDCRDGSRSGLATLPPDAYGWNFLR
jgi:eukaryotic-like serine/threonine-protein kinase